MSDYPPPDFAIFVANGSWRYFLIILLSVYALSLAGTWLSIKLAGGLRLFDAPNTRSSHDKPTPRLGGIGVALGFLGFLALRPLAAGRLPDVLNWPNGPELYLAILAGGCVAFLFGVADDLRGMRAGWKLAFQCLSAALAIGFGVRLEGIHPAGGGLIEFGWTGEALAFVWIVFFMNACNFMDGMDGHLGVFGIVACAALFWPLMTIPEFIQGGWAPRVFLLPALAGALLGFLRFNLSRPARTFMGDGGAQLTGFVLAALVVSAPPGLVIPGLIAVWPFTYDAVFTLVRRARRGENLLRAHREHLYQRLLAAGLSHRQSLGRSLGFQAACLAGSAYYVTPHPWAGGAMASWIGLAIALAATAFYTGGVWKTETRGRRPQETENDK